MKAGSFSRSVVVREWPSRHCFISLPRPWASLTLPAPTPAFNLEVSEERSLLLSWAGDMHNPSPGEENTVLVSREVLHGSGISDGEFGLITQVPVPPPCSSVTVLVGSLAEWQDLALNAEVAQSAFLSQVRVLGIGQSLPLWLEGGVRITLTVTHIDPPSNYGVLQPMTQVEVLPPLEHGESEDFCPINFTPQDLGSQRNSASREESPAVEEEQTECNEVKTRNAQELKKYDQNAFEPLIKYITSKLQQQRIVVDSPHRKDICHGYRVLPLPQSEIPWIHNFIKSHPSLVIISKYSLRNVDYQKQISFVANVKKIDSPRDKSEKSSSSREEDKGSDKQLDRKTPNSEVKIRNHALCTVIVWENFIERKEDDSFIENMTLIMNSHSCVVSDGLRRLMKLETFSIIELNSRDLSVKTLPVSIDISPLGSIDESSCKLICDNIKRLLNDATSEGDVIINKNTLLTCSIEEKDIDIFVTVRDGVPLKLTEKSVVLLDITHVSKPSSVPYISADMGDLDAALKVRFPYVGNQSVLFQLQQHILLGSGLLLKHYKSVPQYALLHGSRGSGKTSLVETLAHSLSGFPHYLHFQIASFKQMKGKKMETVEKKLQLMFREAIFRKPSVIVLEDIDFLVPSKGIDDQESGQFHDHTMQMVNMLKGLLDSLLEFCHGDSNIFPTYNSKSGSVMVVATSVSRTSVHPLLVNPQGCHYFPCSFGIPFLEPEERVQALYTMITAQVDSYTSSFGVSAQKCCKSSVTKQANYSVAYRKVSGIETNLAVKLTENFVLPDLNHLAFRTVLQARQRLESKSSQSAYCISCGNNIIDDGMCNSGSPVSWEDADSKDENESCSLVLSSDLEAARDGYIPLALRGLELSEKKASPTMRVGGLAEACKTLRETLTWPSTYPNLFSRVKLRLRSGVLLYGPPGCGKTLIANSIAASCQLNFISVKGPELLSKYIGASEQAVRDAFERASSAKPCVLFFDEFESIAPRRGHDSTGVTDRVVNQLLTQMDGVEGLSGVYILAATSRPDLIDPALLRPGRLDKCVFCPMPTLQDREDILRILSEDVELGEKVDWAEIASDTENFSGADLQSLLSTAQILVAQEALGEALYEGVIQPAHTEKLDCTEGFASPHESLVDGSDIKAEERNSVIQVVIEKGKIEVDKKRNSTQTVVLKEEESDVKSLNISSSAQESETQSLVGCFAKGQGENQVLRVCQRHIKAALKEVKPSVTLAERKKYELLYESFTKSREGNFGKQTPGKRATLA